MQEENQFKIELVKNKIINNTFMNQLKSKYEVIGDFLNEIQNTCYPDTY